MSKTKTIVHNSYPNAENFKLKNRRVSIVDSEDNKDLFIEFIVMDGNLTPRSLHGLIKDKAVVTTIRITEETAIALAKGLKARLNSKGIF